MIAAAHSDSPAFKIKPNPETDTEHHYIRLNTEGYGGMIDYTWLDRPLAALMPTSDRPVTSDRESLARTFHFRFPKYKAYCDVRISARKNVPTTAEKVIAEFVKHSSPSSGDRADRTRGEGK